jgi:hypothetical protein
LSCVGNKTTSPLFNNGRARATQCRAAHVSWFTRREWHTRYRHHMREHVLVFSLLGLVLMAAIILMIAPAAVTWALAVIE